MRFQNRVQHFITKILQNSRLNREKFVINKRLYNNKKQASQLIIKRQFRSYTPPPNPNPNPWTPFWVSIIVTFITFKGVNKL